MAPAKSPHNTHTPPAHATQSSLFLFELILATAFLALSSVVCIRLYLYARSISRNSAAQTHAISEAQNIADAFLVSDGSLADALSIYQKTLDMTIPDSNLAGSALALGTDDSAPSLVNSDASNAYLYYNSSWSCLNGSQDDAIFSGIYDAGETYTPCYAMELQLSANAEAGESASANQFTESESAESVPSASVSKSLALTTLQITIRSLPGSSTYSGTVLYSLEVQRYEPHS